MNDIPFQEFQSFKSLLPAKMEIFVLLYQLNSGAFYKAYLKYFLDVFKWYLTAFR